VISEPSDLARLFAGERRIPAAPGELARNVLNERGDESNRREDRDVEERLAGMHEGIDPLMEPGFADGLELELGGLVAALSATTEDETELALRVRAFVESGRHRITIGRHRGAHSSRN
jgi:hypothetical protein